MKLLLCRICSDVFSLDYEEKVCGCGKSGGRYVDNINAEYWGKKAMLLGFANLSFAKAITMQIANGDLTEQVMPDGVTVKGRSFEAFVIPASAPSVKKIRRPS